MKLPPFQRVSDLASVRGYYLKWYNHLTLSKLDPAFKICCPRLKLCMVQLVLNFTSSLVESFLKEGHSLSTCAIPDERQHTLETRDCSPSTASRYVSRLAGTSLSSMSHHSVTEREGEDYVLFVWT